MSFDINSIGSQQGRIAIITGANIGLGFETARALAEKKATVIMACRNETKAKQARDEILKEFPTADIQVMLLDLSSLDSVRKFAENFLANFNQLDLLINNAGIMIPPYSKTADGFESQFGTNYLSHFLLTGLLLETLNKTPGARVVSLSSIAHKAGRIHFDDLQFTKKYSRIGAYGQSKLACLMFAYELDRKLKQQGSTTLSVAAHPGASNTNLGQYIPKFLAKPLLPVVSAFFGQSAKEGAQAILYAALGDDVNGGDYFGPTGLLEMKGPVRKTKSLPHSHNLDVAKKLWSTAQELTGISYLNN